MFGSSRHERSDRGSSQRGGRGGGRGRLEQSRDVVVSKALSFLLRHGGKGEGVELDDGGWANLADVLAWRRLCNLSVTVPEIKSLIATNDKQRFALKPDPSYNAFGSPTSPRSASDEPNDPSAYLIRASQGHSLSNISNEKLLTPMPPSDPTTPHLVVHGTYPVPWEQIKASGGLKPISRKHIHFATKVPSPLPSLSVDKPQRVPVTEDGTDKVLSGMRRDATVLVWVDVRKSAKAGVKWWRSANGVVLTDGVDGKLDLEWVVWVERRGTDQVLFGTKPPGGAAAFGVEAGDEEGKATLAAKDDTEDTLDEQLEGLKVKDRKSDKTENGREEARVDLKDNWDD